MKIFQSIQLLSFYSNLHSGMYLYVCTYLFKRSEKWLGGQQNDLTIKTTDQTINVFNSMSILYGVSSFTGLIDLQVQSSSQLFIDSNEAPRFITSILQ